MKLLGNALDRDICGSDIPCLGFCNWNLVSGMFIVHMIVTYDCLSNAARYSLDEEGPIAQGTQTSTPDGMRYPVNNVT